MAILVGRPDRQDQQGLTSSDHLQGYGDYDYCA
jgi:hypothetical protein